MKKLISVLFTLATLSSYADCPKSFVKESEWNVLGTGTTFQICHKVGTPFYKLQRNGITYSGKNPYTDASNTGWFMESTNSFGENFIFSVLNDGKTAKLNTYINDRLLNSFSLILNSCLKPFKLESSWSVENQKDVFQICHQRGTPFYYLNENGIRYSAEHPNTDASGVGWYMESTNSFGENFIFSVLNNGTAAKLNTYINDRIINSISLKPNLIILK